MNIMAKNKKDPVADKPENEAVNTAESGNAADEIMDAEEETPKKKKSKEISPEKAAKKRFNRRKLKFGSVATAITIIVLAVVVAVNVVVDMLSDKVNMSIDLTADGSFEISQVTIDYLATVNEPVQIVCMSNEQTFQTSNYIYYKQAYEVLKKYSIYSGNVELIFIDPVEDPTYTNRFSSEFNYKGDISAYDIIVSSDKRMKKLSIQDLYNTETYFDYYTFSNKEQIVSSKAEQELTSAVMYVTDPDPLQAVLFRSETAGSSYDNVSALLSSNGFDVSEIDPMTEALPEGTDLVVINAPLNDYDTGVIDMLYDFLDNGGDLGKNLIYFADNSQKATGNIDAFLAEWGLKVEDGVVGDQNPNNLQMQSYYVLRDFITENEFSGNVAQPSLPVIDYQSRPITLLFDTKDTRNTVPLLQTQDTAFVLTQAMQEAAANGEDVDIPVGIQTTMALGRKYVFSSDNRQVFSNVLVIGSSENLDEAFTSTTYYNNGDYFVSVINAMTGKTAGISIVAKDLSSDSFDMDQGRAERFSVLFIIIIPVAVLAAGIAVFVRRRTK